MRLAAHHQIIYGHKLLHSKITYNPPAPSIITPKRTPQARLACLTLAVSCWILQDWAFLCLALQSVINN